MCEKNHFNTPIATREICKICYKVNPVGFDVPNIVWHEVIPHQYRQDIICLSCFIHLADEKLISWDRDIKFYPVSLNSHLTEC